MSQPLKRNGTERLVTAFRLSAASNIILMGVVAMLLWRDRLAAPRPAAPPVQPLSVLHERSKPEAAAEPAQLKPAGSVLTAAAVAQLEQRGISRDVLVNVLLEDLDRRSAKRALDLRKKYAPKLVPDQAMRELARQSDAEQIRELKAAFGEEGYLAWDKEQTLRQLNRARVPGDELPMTAAEAAQAYRLQKEFDEKSRDLQIMMEDGTADKADVGTLQARAQQALDGQLEKLLGPQRFNALRGNLDPTTEVYRTYGDLNPTPAQASAVALTEQDYRAREATLARQLNENPADAAKITAALTALHDAQEEDLRRIFGAEAYDTMKRQSDPTYQTLQHYAAAWNLNGSEVRQVYDSVHAFQEQADQLRSAGQLSEQAGQKVDWRAVNAAIDQARQQTEIGLQNTIGPDRLSRLKQNGLLTNQ
jgi:hypothetical protein